MALTEMESIAAIPNEGWLRRYVIHAVKQTTAPLCYHIGMGLTLLAVTCPLAYGMEYAGVLHTNTFTLLVGRSGEDNKSTALGVGLKILKDAAPSLIGDMPGSPEGLVDSLQMAPSQMIPISEFGKFLSSAQRGYFEPIKTLLADVWDSQKITRAKASQRGQRNVITVDDPRLSIGAACSIPYLEKHTLAEDWTGGFMGRWLVFYGRRERVDPDPVGDRTDFQYLVDELRARANQPTAGFCMGLTDPAAALWKEWYFNISTRILPDNIIGIRARAPTLARKIGLILSWDYGPARSSAPWRMDLDVLEPALAMTELHVKSLVDLSEMIAEHEDARLRRSIISAINSKGGVATMGDILAILKRKKRPIQELLDSLLEEKKIKRIQTPAGFAYELQSFL